MVAQTLACLAGVPVTLFDASNVRGVHDWFYSVVFTSYEGLPTGTKLTWPAGAVRLPTLLARAMTDDVDKIVIVTGEHRVKGSDSA
ncbi:MAG: hypothetical protein WD830_04390 [Chloroflexota bacterium]